MGRRCQQRRQFQAIKRGQSGISLPIAVMHRLRTFDWTDQIHYFPATDRTSVDLHDIQ
jgi:hypothetical protein